MEHVSSVRPTGKSKKVVPFSRLEFPNGMSCSIYVSRSLYQFQVHGRALPRTGVYDQMEQLFTNGKFHFCYHRNFRVFFLNGKRPLYCMKTRSILKQTVNCPLIPPDPGASLTARRLYCAFHKHANSKVQKPPSQLCLSLLSIIITIAHKTDRNPQITNHDLLNP